MVRPFWCCCDGRTRDERVRAVAAVVVTVTAGDDLGVPQLSPLLPGQGENEERTSEQAATRLLELVRGNDETVHDAAQERASGGLGTRGLRSRSSGVDRVLSPLSCRRWRG